MLSTVKCKNLKYTLKTIGAQHKFSAVNEIDVQCNMLVYLKGIPSTDTSQNTLHRIPSFEFCAKSVFKPNITLELR